MTKRSAKGFGLFLESALKDIRKHKNSYLLTEAETTDSPEEGGEDVDSLLKGLGDTETEDTEKTPDNPEEGGGDSDKGDKESDDGDEKDSSETEDEVEDQKKEVEAQAVEETDDDSTVSMDMQIDDLLTKEEGNSLDVANQKNIVVDLFAQKALRIADKIDKFIDLPSIVLKRAEKFVRTRYGDKAAAQFQAAIKPSMRKYTPGGVEEYYTQTSPESYSAGAMGSTGSGGGTP